MSFIVLYLSLTGTGMVITRLQTQTNKIPYLCDISQKRFYFNYLFQSPKNPQIGF
jgi:hypothetical protein